MGRSKMIAKSCPKCDQQVAVATKSCKCGHSFFLSRTRSSLGKDTGSGNGGSPGGGTEERRRTARVRRARPHFYDSQDYQRQKRKMPKRRTVSQGSYDEEEKREYKDNGREGNGVSSGQRGRRKTLKPRVGPNETRQAKSPAEPVIDPARLLRYSALLLEINRKMTSVTWAPSD